MATALDQLKLLLAEHVAPLMKQHGYKRSGKRWGKRTHDGWLVFDAQSSQSSSRDAVRFTFNLGMRSDAVCRICNDEPSSDQMPPHFDCHLKRRIGKLLPAHDDKWWIIGSDENPAVLGAEVSGAIREFAIPFLESIGSNAGLLPYANSISPEPRCALVLAVSGRQAFHASVQAAGDSGHPSFRAAWSATMERVSQRAALLGY